MSRITCFSEEEFTTKMTDVVEPFLESVRKTEYIDVEGGRLFVASYPQKEAAPVIVMLHGFTEAAEKFYEQIYYLYNAGYQVVAYDQRSHGRSVRESDNGQLVHVKKFDSFVEDLHAVTEKVVKPMAAGEKMFLFGHSMGGCVSSLYLETYPEDYSAAVLNAPMLGIALGKTPMWAAKALCHVMIAFGQGGRKLFIQGEFDPEEPFSVSCCNSESRHVYFQKKRKATEEYHTAAASYSWALNALNAGRRAVKNVSNVKVPVLLMQGEKDEMVTSRDQDRFAEGNALVTLKRIPDAKHEIYRCQRGIQEPVMNDIVAFFEKA